MSTSSIATVAPVPGAGTRLSLLGCFDLERDGRAVRLATRKEEGLLAYLVLHPGSHPREALAELYWGDTPEPQARGSLRAALTGLRAALGRETLVSDRVAVQFCPPADSTVDVLQFRTQASRFLGDPAADPAAFDPSLYGGELLAGHYDDWVLAEREQLRQLYLDAMLHRAGRLRDLARHGEAIAAAQQVLAVEPAEERAHRHLILLYALAGNRPAALRQLELCRRSLKEELDVEPSAETLALLDAIEGATVPAAQWTGGQAEQAVAGAATMPGRAATAVTAGAPASGPDLTNLPMPPTSFIGRARELAALSELLQDGSLPAGSHRLVTLTGAGGSGKTRLAIQVARLLAPKYRHGAWWVDLSSLRDPAPVADAVLHALRMTPAPGQPALQTLIGFLGARNLLLLLDNCEHLRAACAYLAAAILEACPAVQVLATSRQPLDVPGEQLWPVPTFSIPQASPLDQNLDPAWLLGYDAVQLFLDRARMQRPDFELSRANARQIAEICCRLDGIPLAIELAAARVRTMDLDDLLPRLQSRLRLLASGSQLAPPRQQTLRASIDWSYDLLSPAECLLLQRLAVFVGGCTLEAAEAICAGDDLAADQVLDLLARLVDRSLVVAEAGRYRLLETIREYALERLLDSGEAEAVRERHAAYFAAFLGERRDRLQSHEQQRVIADITAEIGNVRAACDWAVAARREGLLRAANITLIWFCELASQFHEGEAMFARTVEALAADPPADPGLLPLLHVMHGHLLGRLGRLAAAREEIEAGCARLRHVGAPSDLGIGLTLLGLVVWQVGDYPHARAVLEEALALNRSADDKGFIGLCLFILGLEGQSTGDMDQADAYFGEALALARSSGYPRLIAMTAVHSIPTLMALARPLHARERLQEGLALARATQDRWLVFAASGYLGQVLGAQGDYAGATAALQEAFALAQEVGNRHDMAWAGVGLAGVSLAAGDVAQADLHFQSALQLALDAAAFPIALAALAGLAVLRGQTGDREVALELARQVLAHPASTDHARGRAAQVLYTLDPEGENQPAAGTFEEAVRGVLAGSPQREVGLRRESGAS